MWGEMGRHRKAGRFIEACLLCLLRTGSKHGYSLVEELQEFGFEQPLDISVFYRNLRSMEQRELVNSSWEESDYGPNKRVYEITKEGYRALDEWIGVLKDRKQRIERIIENYESSL